MSIISIIKYQWYQIVSNKLISFFAIASKWRIEQLFEFEFVAKIRKDETSIQVFLTSKKMKVKFFK